MQTDSHWKNRERLYLAPKQAHLYSIEKNPAAKPDAGFRLIINTKTNTVRE